jgi:hypothetical protein
MIAEIIIFKQEITHDIEADVRQLERMRKLTDTPILTNDDADRYSLNTQIDLALSIAISRLQAYVISTPCHSHQVAHDHTTDWDEKKITLDMPFSWPQHLLEPLKNAVHRFIVKTALHNFLRVALPQDPYTTLSLDEANEASNRINSLISDRLGPIKIHPTPFG